MAAQPGKVEIRVQGIGDMNFYSALGSPDLPPGRRRVQVADPPPLPRHRLRIVNWSRANRRTTKGIAWYLAFPFTLMNLVGYMQPSRSRPSRVLSAAVATLSVLLTISAFAWLVVLTESVLAHLPGAAPGVRGGWWICAAAAALLVGVLVGRAVRDERRTSSNPRSGADVRPESSGQPESATGSWLTTGVHIAAVIVFALVTALIRPAELPWSGWPSVPTPTAEGMMPKLDAMTALVVVTVLMAMLGAALLQGQSWYARLRRGAGGGGASGGGDSEVSGGGNDDSGSDDDGSDSARGDDGGSARWESGGLGTAGAVLVTAMALLHAGLDLIRMTLDNLTDYAVHVFRPRAVVDPSGIPRLLLAYNDPATLGDNRLDFLPAHAVLFLILLSGSAALVARWFHGPGLWALLRYQAEGWRWLHRVMTDLARVLRWVLLIAGIAMVAGSYAGISWLESSRTERIFPLLLILINTLAAVVVLVVLFAQFHGLRRIIGWISDVAGFWPIRHHPLSGVSYRKAVVAGIRMEIARHSGTHVVLVGHSQGSVLCAWLLAAGGPAAEETVPAGGSAAAASPVAAEAAAGQVQLVTCGSPLGLLYPLFFPAQFTSGFFARVNRNSAAWMNFWRPTDPLATAVVQARNTELPDPRPGDPLNVHFDYWTDPAQMAYIAALPEPDEAPVSHRQVR